MTFALYTFLLSDLITTLLYVLMDNFCLCLALFPTPNTLVKFPEYESPAINDDTSTIIAKFTGIFYKILEIITIYFSNFNLR